MGPPGAHDPAVPKWFDRHAALVISGLLFITVAIKVLVVSHGVPSTAAVLIDAQGVGKIILASLVATLPTAAVGIFFAATMLLMDALENNRPWKGPLVGFFFASILALAFGSWGLLKGMLAIATGFILFSLPYRGIANFLRSRGTEKQPLNAQAKHLGRLQLVQMAAVFWALLWIQFPHQRFPVAP